MRSVRALIYIFLFAVSGSAPAFCYGAVAIGSFGTGSQDYVVVRNESSAESASEKALSECRGRLIECKIAREFVNAGFQL
jgi:hypothetical protein